MSQLSLIDKVHQMYKKYKEIILYLIFGVITTLVNWIVYSGCIVIFHTDMNISNVIAWFVAVSEAYITNRIFVFESKSTGFAEVMKEMGLFYGSRILSGWVELLGFPFLIHIGLNQSVWGIEGLVAKVIVTIIVIVMNYVLSKIIVFRKDAKGTLEG